MNYLKKNWIAYLLIALVAILHAVNYRLFIVPNDFAPSGLNGIATMVQYALHFSVGYTSLIVNIPLCLFGFFFVNRDFSVKSFVFTGVFSVAYLAVEKMAWFDNFVYDANGVDTVFPALISGLVMGLAAAVCFRRNGSTGGTDIVSKYISKKHPDVNFFWVLFTINALVAGASFFVYAKEIDGILHYDWKPVCLCIMYCFVSSLTANALIRKGNTAYKFLIITNHAKEIDAEIVSKLRHGATQLIGTGVYSGLERDVILCVVNKHQLVDFEAILKNFPDTFAFVETVNETIGNFKRIK